MISGPGTGALGGLSAGAAYVPPGGASSAARAGDTAFGNDGTAAERAGSRSSDSRSADARSRDARPSDPNSAESRASERARERNDGGRDASARDRAERGHDTDPARSGDVGRTRAASRTDRAHPGDGEADPADRAAASDFALLLAATAPATATPAAAIPATTGEPAPHAAATDPAAGSLPDQLLALLSGAWAGAPAAASTTTAAPAADPAAPGTTGAAARPVLPNAPALPSLVAAAPPTPASAGNVPPDAFAALAAAAGAPAAASEAIIDPLAGSDATAPAVDALAFAAPAPLAGTPALERSAATAAASGTITMPADPDAGFDDAFGSRIAWMAEQRIGNAEIRLNPEHVGPIDVRIQLDGSRVHAEFHSANADVRHAIESSLGRLRDLLGQHGLQLGQADVGQRQPGQAQAGAGRTGDGNGRDGNGRDDERASTTPVRLRTRGLLDEYA